MRACVHVGTWESGAGFHSNCLTPKALGNAGETGPGGEWGLPSCTPAWWSTRAQPLGQDGRGLPRRAEFTARACAPEAHLCQSVDCRRRFAAWKLGRARLFSLSLSQPLSFMLPLSFPQCISHSRSHSCSLAHSCFPGCIFSSLAVQRM